MPVPRPADGPPVPRRLLRDVVYDQLFEAIADGTLEFGERLNDDELVTWLGVSRTPLREAIAKLDEYALVDVEANRYTRVIDPTVDDFLDTTRTTNEIWAVIAQRAVPLLTDEQATRFLALVDQRDKLIAARDSAAAYVLFDMIAVLLEAAASPSLERVQKSIAARAILMFRRVGKADIYPWSVAEEVSSRIRAGVEARDPEATAAGFVWRDKNYPEFVKQLRAARIFRDGAGGRS